MRCERDPVGWVACAVSRALQEKSRSRSLDLEASTISLNTLSGGRVGIGTATPKYTLDVRGTVFGNGGAIFGDLSGGTVVPVVELSSSLVSTAVRAITMGGNADAVHVEHWSSGRGVYGQSNGGVGVYGYGFDAPGVVAKTGGTGNIMEGWTMRGGEARKFHISQDGTYVAGSDFAESMPARGGKAGYEAGDVLVVSTKAPGKVEKASHPYDSHVAGIYSTRPGVLGADKSDVSRVDADEVPVAIVGIVPTKVSTENGPIQVGDLLTTSRTPGYAMKASPILIRGVKVYRPGTILGKALEPLKQGKSVIKILVTLR